MNKRSFIKFFAALPLAGLVIPKVVLAANEQITWIIREFDFGHQVGVCGAVKVGKHGLKRAAARFAVPAHLYINADWDNMSITDPDGPCGVYIRQAKLAVIENLKIARVAHNDDIDTMEGNEVQIKL